MAPWSHLNYPTARTRPSPPTPPSKRRAEGVQPLMWLTSLAIKRPLILLIGMGMLLGFGLLAWSRLGVELLPAIDAPIVTVSTPYPGAGPDAVDTLVTQKVEDAVSSVNEIDTITSTSVEGSSTVTITFTEKASKDSAHQVEQRVNAIRGDLPTDSKTPIVTK